MIMDEKKGPTNDQEGLDCLSPVKNGRLQDQSLWRKDVVDWRK